MVAAWTAALFVARPDVVVATSPQFFCGWAGALASLVRRVPRSADGGAATAVGVVAGHELADDGDDTVVSP